MTLLHAEEYWTTQFNITLKDLERTAGRLARSGLPRDLKALALPVIQGRLEHGHDPSPAVPGGRNAAPMFRTWDPDLDWQEGDFAILAHDRFGNSKYTVFLGEIVFLDPVEAQIRIDELQTTKTFPRTFPGKTGAHMVPGATETWQAFLLKVVATKLRSGDLADQAEGILLKYGGRLLTCLAEALRQDPRFTGWEGKWVLTDRLPRLEPATLQVLHHFLLQNQTASLDDLLPVITEGLTGSETLMRMAVQSALVRSPERFENIGTAARPQWKARLPAHDRAEVTHFAFDPQTFELLCRPGQRLTQKKARRLQELDLYAHVVTFPEWRLPAHP